ncbi:MAG: hypothetical protein K2X27_18095 [Candidatus Obscuribacterales bacterium]|nr:hypothetical protein [Candidatus Obscuribacterales bacterium]
MNSVKYFPCLILALVVYCGLSAVFSKVHHLGSVGDLKVGDSGWTQRWALHADEHGRLWIDESFPVISCAAGSALLKIHRVESGFVVYLNNPPTEGEFEKRKLNSEQEYAPVIGLAKNCGKQILLPEEYRRKTLKDLKPGQICWTAPWALSRNHKGKPAIKTDFFFSSKRSAIDKMQVQRKPDGFYVNFNYDSRPPAEFCSLERTGWVRVEEARD